MTLHAMAENFVEKHARGASGKNCRSNKRLHCGSAKKVSKMAANLVDRGLDHFRLGHAGEIAALEILHGAEVHSVRRFSTRADGNVRKAAAMQQPAAFGVDQVFRLSLNNQRYTGV